MIWKRTPRPRHRLLDFSPWILGLAWLLLCCLLAFFAVSNYQREKLLIDSSLQQKGEAVSRMVNFTVREELWRELRSGDFSAGNFSWKALMTAALDLVTEEEGVLSAKVVDSRTGQVLASSIARLRGGEPRNFNAKPTRREQRLLNRITLDSGEGRGGQRPHIFLSHNIDGHFLVAASRLQPFGELRRRSMMMGAGHGHGWGQLRRTIPGISLVMTQLDAIDKRQPVLLLNLDYGDFSGPLKRQFMQIALQIVVVVLVGIGGVLSFLTVRGVKQAEKGVADLLTFMERLVAMLPVGLIATDRDGSIRICNRAATEILGTGERELLGRKVDATGDGRLARMVRSAEKTVGSLNGEVSFFDDEGREQVVNFLSRTVGEDGQGEHPAEVIVFQDMTEVKQLEKDLQRNAKLAAVGKMAAGVAHEIRNPLSSIKGLALLMSSRFEKDSTEQTQAETLIAEVERLNRAIGELLDFSRPTRLEKSRFNLARLLKRTVQLVEQDACGCGVRLVLSIPHKLQHHMLQADMDKLSQVLLNLLLNALQSFEECRGEREERRVELGLVVSGNRTVISVRDNGAGIATENLSRVVDPYFTTRREGTGLGLALSAKIIEEHGGRLEVSSEEGRFTEVRVIL